MSFWVIRVILAAGWSLPVGTQHEPVVVRLDRATIAFARLSFSDGYAGSSLAHDCRPRMYPPNFASSAFSALCAGVIEWARIGFRLSNPWCLVQPFPSNASKT